MTKALIGWPIEEVTLEALGIKNYLLLHLGCLGKFSLMQILTESSPSLDQLGCLGRMPSKRDFPSLLRFECPFPYLGLHGWGPRCDELHLLVVDPH